MKRVIILALTMFFAILGYAQTIKLTSIPWTEDIYSKTWTFNQNGTITQKQTYTRSGLLGGVYCTVQIVMTRTGTKWKQHGDTLQCEDIPLQISLNVNLKDAHSYSTAQKQRINAAIPTLKQQLIKEERQNWQSKVGDKYLKYIDRYSPQEFWLKSNYWEEGLWLHRDIEQMTAAQKASYKKMVAEFEAQLQKGKEIREAAIREAEAAKREAEAKAKREAEAKAKREAEEREKRAEEERIKAEKVYFDRIGIEKKVSYDKAVAEGVKLVDLGLSVRWADRNLGASSVTDKGEFYAWGDITPITKEETWAPAYSPVTKPKKGAVLDATSDPATVKWGAGWHVPTVEQWKELFEKCSMKENDDHTGVVFTGPNGNTITFPFTHYTYWAHYWANSIDFKNFAHNASIPRKAPSKIVNGYTLESSDTPKTDSMNAGHLLPVRAVME